MKLICAIALLAMLTANGTIETAEPTRIGALEARAQQGDPAAQASLALLHFEKGMPDSSDAEGFAALSRFLWETAGQPGSVAAVSHGFEGRCLSLPQTR
jgi:hypothetical protein